jgi:outer membrane cobalamin receptor
MARLPGPVSAALAATLATSLAAWGRQEQEPRREGFRDVIGATARPIQQPQAPSTITVLGSQDVEDLGARFLSDALRRIPGVEVARLSSTESSVSFRGYNDDSSASQGILALVDGRSVYNEFFGAVIWETIPVPLDQVEQVEAVRGPSSFFHGPNAMHGLVNIATRAPLQYRSGELFLSGSAGSYGSATASATAVRREGDTGLKATVAWDDINEFLADRDTTKDKKFIEARFETLLEKDHRVELAAGANGQKFAVLIPTFSILPSTVFANEVQEEFVRASYSFGSVKAKVDWTHFLADSVPGTAAYAPFETLLDTANAEVQYSISFLKDTTITGGTGYRLAAFETEDENVSLGRHRTGLAWFFAEGEIEVSDKLWLTGGLRLDDHSASGLSESPRFAAVWELEPGQFVRASAGYGFRNPSLRELWFNMPVLGGAATIAGNRDLEPEQIRSFELGYRGRQGADLRLEGNVYYNLVDRLVEYRSLTPTVFAPRNTNKEEAYGLELEADYWISDPVSLFGNYAYSVRLDRDTHDRLRSAPRHKANAGARVTVDRVRASLWVNFFDDVEHVDPAGGASLGALDEYALVNARVSWRTSVGSARSEVYVQAFNLLDHDHREHPEGQKYGLILVGGVDLAW